ncbi:MAG: hypothetical protein AAB373_00890 [Patescibacteria group bacterium]
MSIDVKQFEPATDAGVPNPKFPGSHILTACVPLHQIEFRNQQPTDPHLTIPNRAEQCPRIDELYGMPNNVLRPQKMPIIGYEVEQRITVLCQHRRSLVDGVTTNPVCDKRIKERGYDDVETVPPVMATEVACPFMSLTGDVSRIVRDRVNVLGFKIDLSGLGIGKKRSVNIPVSVCSIETPKV